jgi:quercetin dioxygenase-like cupin family protein
MTSADVAALVDRRVDGPYPEALPGVQRHVSQGDGFTVLRLRFAAGAVLPRHEHEHEQYIHVVTGALSVTVGATEPETVTLGAGDAVRLPAWLPHETRAVTDAETLEVFSPRRADLS